MIRNLILLSFGLSFSDAIENTPLRLAASIDRTAGTHQISHTDAVSRNLVLTPQCQTEMTRIEQFVTYNTDIFTCDLANNICVVSGTTITCDWEKTVTGNDELQQQCAAAGGVYTTVIFTADVITSPDQPYSTFVFNNYGMCLGDSSICTSPEEVLLDLERDFESLPGVNDVVITCAGSPRCGGSGTSSPGGESSRKSAKAVSAKATSAKSAKAVSAKAKSAKSAKAVRAKSVSSKSPKGPSAKATSAKAVSAKATSAKSAKAVSAKATSAKSAKAVRARAVSSKSPKGPSAKATSAKSAKAVTARVVSSKSPKGPSAKATSAKSAKAGKSVKGSRSVRSTSKSDKA